MGKKERKMPKNTTFWAKIDQNKPKMGLNWSKINNFLMYSISWKNIKNWPIWTKKHCFWVILSQKQAILSKFDAKLNKKHSNWAKFEINLLYNYREITFILLKNNHFWLKLSKKHCFWPKNTQFWPKMTKKQQIWCQKSAFHECYTSKKCWKWEKKDSFWANLEKKETNFPNLQPHRGYFFR